jgi:hypothetical protein
VDFFSSFFAPTIPSQKLLPQFYIALKRKLYIASQTEKYRSNVLTPENMFQPLISGPASNFPPKQNWLDFDTLFNRNMSELSASGNTNTDVECIRAAIHQNAALVESRVLLCIIMQESSGNVGVQTTGDDDAGLMQAHGSPGFPGQHGLSQVRSRTFGGIRFHYGALLTNVIDV